MRIVGVVLFVAGATLAVVSLLGVIDVATPLDDAAGFDAASKIGLAVGIVIAGFGYDKATGRRR